jgi:hypothetical protein
VSSCWDGRTSAHPINGHRPGVPASDRAARCSLFGGLLGGCDGGEGERVVILEVVERAENEEVLDLGAMGDSKGDVLTFANDMYDADNEDELGTDQGFCVRVGEAWECNWTLDHGPWSWGARGRDHPHVRRPPGPCDPGHVPRRPP